MKILEFETYTGDKEGKYSKILLFSTVARTDSNLVDFIKMRQAPDTEIYYQRISSKAYSLLVEYLNNEQIIKQKGHYNDGDD